VSTRQWFCLGFLTGSFYGLLVALFIWGEMR
jgi:hypothetical protein